MGLLLFAYNFLIACFPCPYNFLTVCYMPKIDNQMRGEPFWGCCCLHTISLPNAYLVPVPPGVAGFCSEELGALKMRSSMCPKPSGITGPVLHSKKRPKTKTEFKAPTVGALFRVFFLRPFSRLGIWARKPGEIKICMSRYLLTASLRFPYNLLHAQN